MATLGGYVRNCQIQKAVLHKFKHKGDGRSYVLKNVRQIEGFEQMFIVTKEGVRMPLDECLEDIEVGDN